MGFLDKLFGSKDESGAAKGPSSALLRLQKKAANKYGQPQDRQHALKALADEGTEEAVTILLKRFTFRIEQSIGDEEEKHLVCDDLIRLGPISVPPILEFLETENSAYWPIKALREIVGDEKTVDHLLAIIDRAEAIFDRDIQRKVELVSNLREFHQERVRDLLMEFLKDENEELRVQAVEGLLDLGHEDVADVMVDRLTDEEETQRVKTAILNLLIDKKWKVKQRKDEIRKIIPQSFWIDDTGVIRRR